MREILRPLFLTEISHRPPPPDPLLLSPSLTLTVFSALALIGTRTFSASPLKKKKKGGGIEKKSSPSPLVAVAMTTAINLTVLLHSTHKECLHGLILCPLCPAHLHHSSEAGRRGFPRIHTRIFAWETERYYISEISFHPEYGVPLRPGDEDAVRATDY